MRMDLEYLFIFPEIRFSETTTNHKKETTVTVRYGTVQYLYELLYGSGVQYTVRSQQTVFILRGFEFQILYVRT